MQHGGNVNLARSWLCLLYLLQIKTPEAISSSCLCFCFVLFCPFSYVWDSLNRYGGREAFYNVMIKFSFLVGKGHEAAPFKDVSQWYSFPLHTHLDEKRMLEGAGVGRMSFHQDKALTKTISRESRPFSEVYFTIIILFFLLPEPCGDLS